PDDENRRGEQADNPPAHRPELGPLGPDQLGDDVRSAAQPRSGRGPRRHGVASARNSTASLVSSMYASSRDARWAESSANGTELSESSFTTRSGVRPATGMTSRAG